LRLLIADLQLLNVEAALCEYSIALLVVETAFHQEPVAAEEICRLGGLRCSGSAGSRQGQVG
jgi:hypothetical protein